MILHSIEGEISNHPKLRTQLHKSPCESPSFFLSSKEQLQSHWWGSQWDFTGIGNSSAADQKRQLLAAENCLPGSQDRVTECVFPWHSQEQVAPKLWKSTFLCSTGKFSCSPRYVYLGHGRVKQWHLQDRLRKFRKKEGWSLEKGSPDTRGCELRDWVLWLPSPSIILSSLLHYFHRSTCYDL